MMTNNYKCCMCGDPGLSNELFRCKLCHFRSQHRYCSNIYPKAESYTVCNWCLIQKNDDNMTTTTTIISNTSSSNSSSPSVKRTTKTTLNGPKLGPGPGPGPKLLKPKSPIKKPILKSQEAQMSPSSRKRITAVQNDDEKLTRTKKSSQDKMSNNNYYFNNNNNNNNNNSGTTVIKHVFKNKVRRYKLLDEVSG